MAEWQDRLHIEANSARPFAHPAWDPETLKATRAPLLALARRLPDTRGSFGSRRATNPIKHLLGTASGWGGLPRSSALPRRGSPGSPELGQREGPVTARGDEEILPPGRGEEPLEAVVVRADAVLLAARSSDAWLVRRVRKNSAVGTKIVNWSFGCTAPPGTSMASNPGPSMRMCMGVPSAARDRALRGADRCPIRCSPFVRADAAGGPGGVMRPAVLVRQQGRAAPVGVLILVAAGDAGRVEHVLHPLGEGAVGPGAPLRCPCRRTGACPR